VKINQIDDGYNETEDNFDAACWPTGSQSQESSWPSEKGRNCGSLALGHWPSSD